MSSQLSVSNAWFSAAESHSDQLAVYAKIAFESGVKHDAAMLMHRFTRARMQDKIRSLQYVVHALQQEFLFTYPFAMPYLFMLSDDEGTIVHVFGTEAMIQYIEHLNMGVGTSLSIQHAGVNATSIALLSRQRVALPGSLHTLQVIGSGIQCLCTPIRRASTTVGYLNLTFGLGHEIVFAQVLLEAIAAAVEKRLTVEDADFRLERMIKALETYRLTAREQQIAIRWLQNNSALHIACTLGITEGTVRNMLKRIYDKTDVSDKSSFYLKFASAQSVL